MWQRMDPSRPSLPAQPSPKNLGKGGGGFKGGYTRRGLIYSFYEILRALCHAVPNQPTPLFFFLTTYAVKYLVRTLSLMRDMIWQMRL